MYYCIYRRKRLTGPNAGGVLALCVSLIMTIFCGSSVRGDEYVLLQNGNVIQGTATSVGPIVVIRSGAGSELKLEARQVAFSASTLSELYDFRVASRQTSDVTSHHDDARWCLRNGLYAEMTEALQAAQTLDPTHPETIRLRRQLQAAINSSQGQAAADFNRDDHSHASPVLAASSTPPREPPLQRSDDALVELNVSGDALAFFTSRVQPVLINRCGNSGCHRSPAESHWNLTHMGVQVRPPARMTRLNLVATLKLVNQAEPLESDLLRYAVHPHAGRREPPLRRVDDVALDSLREWVHQVSMWDESNHAVPLDPRSPLDAPTEFATDSTLALPRSASPRFFKTLPLSPVMQAGHIEAHSDSGIGQPVLPTSFSHAAVPADSRPTDSRPTRLPPIDDPFDPNIFNRHYRDEAAASGADK